MPAAANVTADALPIGLAHGVQLTRNVAAGEVLRFADVAIGEALAVTMRREAERFVEDASA